MNLNGFRFLNVCVGMKEKKNNTVFPMQIGFYADAYLYWTHGEPSKSNG
jgi:hypothetical protein